MSLIKLFLIHYWIFSRFIYIRIKIHVTQPDIPQKEVNYINNQLETALQSFDDDVSSMDGIIGTAQNVLNQFHCWDVR